MPINFTDSPANGATITQGNTAYTYNSSKGVWNRTIEAASALSEYATLSALPLVDVEDDTLAKVLDTNKLYKWTGTGWYFLDPVNTNPTITTGGNASYELATDGTPTVVTLAANDPEGFPIIWSYVVTAGSLGSTATVSQADNVFTITPSIVDANAGDFTLTFTASDGVNLATSASEFSLSFILPSPTLSVSPTTGLSTGTFELEQGDKLELTGYGDVTSVTGYNTAYGIVYTFTPNSSGDISVKMWGAGGAGDSFTAASGFNGGGGAFIEGIVSVVGGQQYQFIVGNGGWSGDTAVSSAVGGWGGGGGNNSQAGYGVTPEVYGTGGVQVATSRGAIGGGGGGCTGLFLGTVGLGNEIMVVGAGGGGGYNTGTGGAGVYAGSNNAHPDDPRVDGAGGSDTSAGTNAGGANTAGARGRGGPGYMRGGGGGAGYYGGAGGLDASSSPSGGGGGSSYTHPTLVNTIVWANGSPGRATRLAGGYTDVDYADNAGKGGLGAVDQFVAGGGRIVIQKVL